MLPLRPIDDYGKKVKKLGEGAYGTVSLVEGKLGSFAVKTYRSVDITTEYIISNDALLEIGALKRLQHPNVVQIVDFVIINEKKIGIVQPLAKSDLKVVISPPYGTATPPQEQLDRYAYRMLLGVAYIHSRHILHRDIKPQNFLVAADQDIWLADFGLAKPFACNPNSSWTNLVYTLWYRPLEILLDTESNYTLSADIWALGATLWEVYTGRPLFGGDSEVDQIFRILRVAGTPNEDRWPEALTLPNWSTSFPQWPENRKVITDVPELKGKEIANLISQMLSLNPKDRPTAYQVLRNPYFDRVRLPDREDAIVACSVSREMRDRTVQIQKYDLGFPAGLDVRMRIILVDWLADVHKLFKMEWGTFFCAIALLDQALLLVRPDREKLQLFGMVCLSFASQLYDTYSPELNDWVYISDNLYTGRQVNLMRLQMLRIMNGDFIFTTAHDYFEENYDYPIGAEVWNLGRAIMVIMTISVLRLELLPHQQYHLALGHACVYYNIAPPSEEINRLVIKYPAIEFKREVKTWRKIPGLIKLFEKATGGEVKYAQYFKLK